MIIKYGRHFFLEIHGVRKGLWAFFLDCAFFAWFSPNSSPHPLNNLNQKVSE